MFDLTPVLSTQDASLLSLRWLSSPFEMIKKNKKSGFLVTTDQIILDKYWSIMIIAKSIGGSLYITSDDIQNQKKKIYFDLKLVYFPESRISYQHICILAND